MHDHVLESTSLQQSGKTQQLQQTLEMQQIRQLPVSTLAYIGDAYYELWVRRRLLSFIVAKSGDLHHLTVKLVNATFQAALVRQWQKEDILDLDEEAIFLRGRNGNPGAMAKHADPVDYRLATGLETLVGYLYLSNKLGRLNTLLQPEIDRAILQMKVNKYGNTKLQP